jgi:hypothetical protein
MNQFERLEERDYQSVRNYINNEKPLVQEECRPFWHKADMLALKLQREPNWLESVLERFLVRVDRVFARAFTRLSSNCDQRLNGTKAEIISVSLRVQGSLILSLML